MKYQEKYQTKAKPNHRRYYLIKEKIQTAREYVQQGFGWLLIRMVSTRAPNLSGVFSFATISVEEYFQLR